MVDSLVTKIDALIKYLHDGADEYEDGTNGSNTLPVKAIQSNIKKKVTVEPLTFHTIRQSAIINGLVQRPLQPEILEHIRNELIYIACEKKRVHLPLDLFPDFLLKADPPYYRFEHNLHVN